jgi:hypothetical protein
VAYAAARTNTTGWSAGASPRPCEATQSIAKRSGAEPHYGRRMSSTQPSRGTSYRVINYETRRLTVRPRSYTDPQPPKRSRAGPRRRADRRGGGGLRRPRGASSTCIRMTRRARVYRPGTSSALGQRCCPRHGGRPAAHDQGSPRPGQDPASRTSKRAAQSRLRRWKLLMPLACPNVRLSTGNKDWPGPSTPRDTRTNRGVWSDELPGPSCAIPHGAMACGTSEVRLSRGPEAGSPAPAIPSWSEPISSVRAGGRRFNR